MQEAMGVFFSAMSSLSPSPAATEIHSLLVSLLEAFSNRRITLLQAYGKYDLVTGRDHEEQALVKRTYQQDIDVLRRLSEQYRGIYAMKLQIVLLVFYFLLLSRHHVDRVRNSNIIRCSTSTNHCPTQF